MPHHKPVILFLTNSELGQASVVLAVAHELVSQSTSDVHVASFPALKQHADALNVPFHALPGRSMKEALADSGLPYLPQHAPGSHGAVESYRNGLQRVVAPWEPEDYAPIYRACLDLINKLSPDLVVVEPLFGPGQDACNVLKQRYLVLSPATFKDHLVQAQPYLGVLWKYPVISSGLPYPIPFRSIALNIYLIFKLVTTTFLSPRIKALTHWRNKIGIPGELTTIYANFNETVPWLVPSIPQSDFPLHIPPNITGCGPILPPFETMPNDHPTAAWLAKRPTILFNLGSHMKYTVADAQQVISALTTVLTKYPDVQVLWKCQLYTTTSTKDALNTSINTTNSDTDTDTSTIASLIPTHLTARILVTPWITPSPASILAHQNTITAVHHGGSNSFHEALAAGVAQVVCPVWLDTYDFAARVEFLGVGVRGNALAAPRVEGGELGRAICATMEDGGGMGMGGRARELQAHIAALDGGGGDVFGVGRRRAARVILDLVE